MRVGHTLLIDTLGRVVPEGTSYWIRFISKSMPMLLPYNPLLNTLGIMLLSSCSLIFYVMITSFTTFISSSVLYVAYRGTLPIISDRIEEHSLKTYVLDLPLRVLFLTKSSIRAVGFEFFDFAVTGALTGGDVTDFFFGSFLDRRRNLKRTIANFL